LIRLLKQTRFKSRVVTLWADLAATSGTGVQAALFALFGGFVAMMMFIGTNGDSTTAADVLACGVFRKVDAT